MRKMIGITAAVAMMAAPVLGANLNIAVQNNADGAAAVTVLPSGVVNYRIVGQLSDSLNDGLALWGGDVAMSPPVLLSPMTAGPGTCVGTTCTGMGCFVANCGITNPAGYGGTQSGNNLLQVGGGQNTIKNTSANAPFPIGNIIEGIAQSQQVLATGSVTMPAAAGVYMLALSNVFANEIVDGQVALNGAFFQTVASGVGTVGSLVITVDVPVLQVSLVSSNPANLHVDSLDTGNGPTLTAGIGGLGTAVQGATQYATVSVTFSGPVSGGLVAGDITIACTGGACPGVGPGAITGAGAGPYEIPLTSVIPPLQCTTINFSNASKFTANQRVQYRNSPGNVTQDGAANTQDLLGLISGLNNGQANAQPERYNINRSTGGGSQVNTQDLLRLINVLNGTNVTQAFNGAALASCP